MLQNNLQIGPPPRRVSMGFLRKSYVFTSESAYAFRYKADIPCPLTNMENEMVTIPIRDIRDAEPKPSLDEQGFEILSWQSPLVYDQFGSEECVREMYLPALRRLLIAHLGAQRVDFVRHRVGRCSHLWFRSPRL